MDWLLIFGVITSVYMAFNIAANDIGNSMGTAVGSGSLKMKNALILGAIFVVIGALFLGNNVIQTVGSGIIPQGLMTGAGAFIITLTAGLWITFTIIRKTPISGSDAIIGAVFGYGIVSVGINNLNFGVLGLIALSWILSPVIGLLTGFGIYYLIKRVLIKKIMKISFKSRIEKVFSYLQIGSSSFAAINLGALDIAVATGVLIATVGTTQVMALEILGAVGLVSGILIAGNRVTATIGRRITELVPTRGFSAQMAAALVVFFFVLYGMPISPTQTLVGSVIGVGLARGTATLKMDIVKDIAYTWIVTIPACILIAMSLYFISILIF
ncbi:MAG: anion permease [Methanomicrobiales archaeon]